jgi:hypothetical protein
VDGNDVFIKSQYQMLKLSIECTRFENNSSNCIGRSSENICCTSRGGAPEKREKDETQFTTKIDGFPSPSRPTLLNANILFGRFFLILTRVWPNSGFWCCNFLSLQIALIYVPINTRSGNTKRGPNSKQKGRS